MSTQQPHDPRSPDDLPPEDAMSGSPGGADAADGAPTCTVTVQQLDALDRSLRMIAAHGDLLASVPAAELAPGTVPVIGQAIHDHAQAMRSILDDVETQRPGRAYGVREGVEELRAGYAVALH